MTRSATSPAPALTAALAAAALLGACARPAPPEEAAPPPQTQAPAAEAPADTAPAAGSGDPDSRGVVVYRDYAAVVARRGDTVQRMAERVGVPAPELAAYNGLPTSYVPKPGDELVLPPRQGGYPAPPAAQSAAAQPAAQGAPLSEAPAAAAPAAGAEATQDSPGGWNPARIGALLSDDEAEPEAPAPADSQPPAPSSGDGYREVAYHEVAPQETVYSIARRYGVPAETLIAWNALSGPNYSVSPGQVLVIPGAGQRPAAEEAARLNAPGESGQAAPPPSAGAPLPPDTVRPRPLESPRLGRFQTPPAEPGAETAEAAAPEPATAGAEPPTEAPPTEAPAADPDPAAAPRSAAAPAAGDGRLLRPVPGEVLRPYSRQPGEARNDGVDFAAEVGQPVRAAADGTVALVSTSLGEWGNIVLLRHDDRLMTVYGRMGTVAVAKGETVRAGDVLGDVAAPDQGRPSLHFEVREGAFSQDPVDFF
jgi:murein DD-endopeptidase MepM/ murein hydrolase activator NlpD